MTLDFRLPAKFLQKLPARLFSVFLLVGLANTAVGYTIYVIGVAANVPPVLALAIATVLGAAFNYASTGFVVFNNRSLDRLPRFVAAYLLTYLVNAALLAALIALGLGPVLSQLVLLPFIALLSFTLFRNYVFTGGQQP